jgi:hypothetical protein
MGVPLDSIAHVIQVALTPVFLLTGIASLLSVINARLGRIADQSDAAHAQMLNEVHAEAALTHAHLVRLRRRLRALDASRALGALGGIAICFATFALFLGALQNAAVATALFLTFGASVLCTMASLVAFFIEILLSSRRRIPPLIETQMATSPQFEL